MVILIVFLFFFPSWKLDGTRLALYERHLPDPCAGLAASTGSQLRVHGERSRTVLASPKSHEVWGGQWGKCPLVIDHMHKEAPTSAILRKGGGGSPTDSFARKTLVPAKLESLIWNMITCCQSSPDPSYRVFDKDYSLNWMAHVHCFSDESCDGAAERIFCNL